MSSSTKRKIKVFGFPSHSTLERTTGVDFARVIQPMTELAKHPDFEVTLFDINKTTDWLDVTSTNDIIFFNYLQDPWGYAAMGAMARKKGVKLVLDLDDSLWDISKDNPAYKVFFPGSEALRNFTAIAGDVDYITTTNPYLRNVIIHNTTARHETVKIIPNYINLDLYKHKSPFKNDHQIVLTHFGSTTHFLDLAKESFGQGIDMIMKEYPNVILKTVGALIPEYKKKWGARYEQIYGDVDIYKWISDKFPKFMDDTDILVTPLIDNRYNRCKSPIKYLEASSAQIPGVWENIRQYEEVIDGTNGLLAHSAQDWHDQIKKLIDDADLRKSMGEKAYEDVKSNWTIQGNIDSYVDFLKSIV